MNNSSRASFYGKNEAKIVGGIALIMMFIHHFAQPSLVPTGETYHSLLVLNGINIDFEIAYFCKLCVAIFAFTTGYALWLNRGNAFAIKSLFFRVFNFLASYWLVYLLFLLYALITQDRMAPSLFLHVANMFGLFLGTEYICPVFAWYVYFYICVLLLSPLLVGIFHLRIGYICIFLLTFICICFNLETGLLRIHFLRLIVSALVDFLPSVLLGMLVAKYALFEKMNDIITIRSSLLRFVLSSGLFLLIFYLRYINVNYIAVYPYFFDSLLAAAFVFGLLKFLASIPLSAPLNKALAFIGIQSMNLWFIHSIYFVGEKYPIYLVYRLHNPVLIMLVSLIMILPFAMFLTYIQKFYFLRSAKIQ